MERFYSLFFYSLTYLPKLSLLHNACPIFHTKKGRNYRILPCQMLNFAFTYLIIALQFTTNDQDQEGRKPSALNSTLEGANDTI